MKIIRMIAVFESKEPQLRGPITALKDLLTLLSIDSIIHRLHFPMKWRFQGLEAFTRPTAREDTAKPFILSNFNHKLESQGL